MSTKKRVLIVDDSPTQARQLALVLQLAEFQVEVASNGKSALQALEAEPFDLVMSDVLMPDINGYELCQIIKESPKWKATPVILLTTLNDVDDIMRGLAVGADNFVAKPYETQSLLDRIRTVFNNHYDASSGTEDATRIEFRLLGKNYEVTATRQQIMAFLLATFEDYAAAKHKEKEALRREMERKRATSEILVKKNRELVKMNRRLETANDAYARVNEELATAHKRLDNSFDELKREQALHEIARERMQIRQKLGRTVREMLIPEGSAPSIPGLEIAYSYRAGAETGGDWLGFVHDERGRTLSIFMGDVGAQGASATLVSAAAYACASTIQALYERQNLDSATCGPRETLGVLNGILRDMAQGKVLMTFLATGLDYDRRILHIANAGHPPPLIFRPGEIEERQGRWHGIYGGAMPSYHLGDRDESDFPSRLVTLQSGDLIVWLSNGVSLGESAGERRFVGWIREAFDKPADKIRLHLDRKIQSCLGKDNPPDDIAYIIARVE